jgi:choline dehydrogenase-like flavoprotein
VRAGVVARLRENVAPEGVCPMNATLDGHRYNTVIVGSGMGGATLARELTRAGKDVLVIERGRRESRIGTFGDAPNIYDSHRMTRTPRTSREGVILWRTLMAGGSTVVSCGNAVPCLVEELAEHGIDISAELESMGQEMGVSPLPEENLSEMGRRIRSAAAGLGLTFDLMPKMVDPETCTACGACTLGCRARAKWTAERPLAEAIATGASVRYESLVDRVLRTNGRATGVSGHDGSGPFEVRAETVVLAAGGIGTPPILAASGMPDAGGNLFIDMLVNVYGVAPEPLDNVEPQMSLVNTELHDERGFIMAPFVNYPRGVRLIEEGRAALKQPVRQTLGIMVKTADDPSGRVNADGSVSKTATPADQRRIDDGAAVATEILISAGADRRSISVTKPQGGHPGGTAAIGTVVDSDLQTRVDGLFVCDCSVLPMAPGMPPMMTIGALALRLGRTLAH